MRYIYIYIYTHTHAHTKTRPVHTQACRHADASMVRYTSRRVCTEASHETILVSICPSACLVTLVTC